MKKDTVIINDIGLDVYSVNTIVVGTGCAGYNAADSLYSMGQRDIAIVTEGINMGTSRNTGSDKQTYYKLTLAGEGADSVVEMAKTLSATGCMHGDIALVEAALSARCFYKLAGIGVPFPHNRYGEYIGYKTDHDPRQRATSAGPLTSRYMTEKLEEQVKQKGITIFDGFLVTGLLTMASGDGKKVFGLMALDTAALNTPNKGIVLFNCTNIIYATGGPAGMYATSVYPESQTGASGIAFEAGAGGVNLTESQYGIASVKFRWNLSGTFQQVIPRYISTNPDGSDEKEFLKDYFVTPGQMMDAVFLKGYQWPFDPRKISGHGSSLIDILVYYESQVKGRRVYLDFMRNPVWGSKEGELDFSLLGEEPYTYLENSGALFGKPVERLAHMNQPAIDLYRNNGIDLYNEYLEIAVSAQHNNGGLAGNIWWESNIRHLFPVGEVNGTFGVYRPGGSALNSTQVGSLRAAQYIYANYGQEPMELKAFVKEAREQLEEKLALVDELIDNRASKANVIELRSAMQLRMTKLGAHIRSLEAVEEGIESCRQELESFTALTRIASVHDLPHAFRNRDILITQFVYLNAIKEYIKKGGGSRGSYLVQDSQGNLPLDGFPEEFRFCLDKERLLDTVCEMVLEKQDGTFSCRAEWKPVRPIPREDSWFENIWNEYMKGNVVK